MYKEKIEALFWILMTVGAASLLYGLAFGGWGIRDLVSVASGVIAVHIVQWMQDRRENPYRWTCPSCHFKIKGNQEWPVQQMQMTHWITHAPKKGSTT